MPVAMVASKRDRKRAMDGRIWKGRGSTPLDRPERGKMCVGWLEQEKATSASLAPYYILIHRY
eukprot:8728784-Prorocentrum_lima.AAC.1